MCALLAGVQTTAQAFQISTDQVKEALSSVRLERSQFLSNIAQLVLRMMREQGSSSVCEALSLPEHVLKVLSGEMVVLPRKGTSQISSVAASQIPSLPASQVFSVTRVERDMSAETAEQVSSIQAKVRALYEGGVEVRLIQCLYSLPPVLVHSWGGFSKARNPEKFLRLQGFLIDRLQQGCDLDTAISGMHMTKAHAKLLLGECEEMAAALSVSPERRDEIIEKARRAARPGRIAYSNGLPKATVHRWLRGDFSHVGGESPYIQNDSLGHAAVKRNCLELYYLGGREVMQTAQAMGLDPETVTQIVGDFEQKASMRAEEDST